MSKLKSIEEVLNQEVLKIETRKICESKPYLSIEEAIEYHDNQSIISDKKKPGVTLGTYTHLFANIQFRMKKIKKDYC